MPGKKRIQKPAWGAGEEFSALHTAHYQMCGVDDTVYNFHDRTSHGLPRSLSVILQGMKGFTGIAALIGRLEEAGFRGIDREAVRLAVRDLHESGLVVTKDEALALLRAPASAPPPPAIATAAWITRDRPDSLVASIESFAANFRTYGHAPGLFISDDSPDGTASGTLAARLDGLARRESISLRFMGRRERRILRDTILETTRTDGLPPAVLDFALFGFGDRYPSYGANRNTVLLANAGDMLLCTDDDVFCDLRVPEEAGYDFELSSSIQPDVRVTYPDRATLAEAHRVTAADICLFHRRLLGKSTPEILNDCNDSSRIRIRDLLPEDLTFLATKAGEVKTTVAGVSGDSGMVSPRYLFWLRGEARDQYTASEEEFLMAHSSKIIFQSSSQFAVSFRSFYPGMNIGIDNRDMLVPFLPVLRGEDTLFARMLRSVSGHAMVGVLPVTIFHNPPGHRLYGKDAVLDVRPDMAEVFILLLQNHPRPVGCNTPAEHLADLGTYFSAIGSLPLEEFEEHLKNLWLSRSMSTTAEIERMLAVYDYRPSYWAEYLEKYILNLRDFSYVRFVTAIKDMHAADQRSAAESCRETIQLYGELLRWWPVIFDAARTIRGDG